MGKKNKEKKKDKPPIKEQIANVLNLPKDLVLGRALLSFIGNSEAYIENYRGIIEYTDKVIRIETRTGNIAYKGKGLRIEYYTQNEMKIVGYIEDVNFE